MLLLIILVVLLSITVVGLVCWFVCWYGQQKKSRTEAKILEESVAAKIKDQQDYLDHQKQLIEDNEAAISRLKAHYQDLDQQYSQHQADLAAQLQKSSTKLAETLAQLESCGEKVEERQKALQRFEDELEKSGAALSEVNKVLEDAKVHHADLMKRQARDEDGTAEVGWSLDACTENEKRLVEVLRHLQVDYPDLKVELGGIIWRKVRMGKIQMLIKRENLDGVCGIYRLTCKEDERCCYIGQATNIKERWYQHIKKMVGAEEKGNERLYRYGPEDFYWEVVERTERKDLNAREKWWIEYYASDSVGLNKKAGGE